MAAAPAAHQGLRTQSFGCFWDVLASCFSAVAFSRWMVLHKDMFFELLRFINRTMCAEQKGTSNGFHKGTMSESVL